MHCPKSKWHSGQCWVAPSSSCILMTLCATYPHKACVSIRRWLRCCCKCCVRSTTILSIGLHKHVVPRTWCRWKSSSRAANCLSTRYCAALSMNSDDKSECRFRHRMALSNVHGAKMAGLCSTCKLSKSIAICLKSFFFFSRKLPCSPCDLVSHSE